MNISYFNEKGWRVVEILRTAERLAARVAADGLPLADEVRAFLDHSYPQGIYRHQKAALELALDGQAVCLATGTASGKSLVFQTAALDCLARDPQARIMAIYPMKALSNEQRDRWERALVAAGSTAQVGRIDGNIPPAMRAGVLERSRVVVFTPDILHAWVFSNLNLPAVQEFLRRTALVVVDEVHTYTGVFGSNAAYLFRRLQHSLALLGACPGYICASATIADPSRHLNDLFGMDFRVIGADQDSSPRHPLEVALVNPPSGSNALDAVVGLLDHLANDSHSRFITFVDSRKQVELMSSILARSRKESAEEKEEARPKTAGRGKAAKPVEPFDAPEEETPEGRYGSMLEGLNVLPYRAGYEERDRQFIQDQLTRGLLSGVISTSALELGIDIPSLDTCILIGVPASATSLQQRIGRIGRNAPGRVIVVNGGDVYDRAVFANPSSFFERPLAESALYLQNRYIQYIHALCLARVNGEHNQIATRDKHSGGEFHSPVVWPEGFLELCNLERSGQTPRDLIGMRNEGKEHPNYAFPLREVESQFKVERFQGPTSSSLGSVSFSQLLREAYPGAVYYYATVPYRVTRINIKAHQVQVRREKRYTTRPNRLPDRAFPRVNPGGVYDARGMGSIFVAECQLMVRESINGVVEQRGGNEILYPYPLPRELGFVQDQAYFTRNFFTTGVLISHPALAKEGVFPPAVAELLYEAFMLLIPYDRQDIGWAADHLRQTRPPFALEGQPFVCIFDQTYGSLRLSARLMEEGLLGRVLLEACILAGEMEQLHINSASRQALGVLALEVLTQPLQPLAFAQSEVPVPPGWEKVVMPESKGLLLRSNEEFRVIRLVQTPMGACYEGVPASLSAAAATTSMPQLIDVAEIPGESRMGLFDPATGTLEALPAGELLLGPVAGEQRAAIYSPELAAERLAAHCELQRLLRIAVRLGLDLGGETERTSLARRVAGTVGPKELVEALLQEE
jgi:DEAD/DEAH box helicase domain-containing protein